MSSDLFKDVGDFHRKFGLDTSDEPGTAGPRGFDPEVIEFRRRFMEEELEEFDSALFHRDDAGMLDALVDLVYVAIGTAHLLGYPFAEAWNAVQEANLKKVRAKPDGSDSKRGSAFDVVKPEGWTPPDIRAVLGRNGFE